MDNFSKKMTGKLKVILFLVLVASLSLGAYINTAKEIKLTIDDENKNVKTYKNTVNELIKEQELNLKKGSYVSVPLDEELKSGMHIQISSPVTYILNDNGVRTEIKSPYKNVINILEDFKIILGEKDYTVPDLHEKMEAGKEIEIVRVKEAVETVEEEIPFKEVVKEDKKLEEGKTKVVEEGKPGIKKKKVKKVFENGEVISRTLLDEKVVSEPEDKLVVKGTMKEPVVKSSRGSLRIKKTITMNATAYDDSPASQGKWVGRTATGVKPQRGVVAVDPKVIPLGTKLYVESTDGFPDYGYCVAGDTGGAIKGNRIDLFFHKRSEVRNFGRRSVKVHILN